MCTKTLTEESGEDFVKQLESLNYDEEGGEVRLAC